MGTRSVVALPTADGGFKGRYVHWDGYPEGVGLALMVIVARDGVQKAAEVLVRDNYGWSSIDSTQTTVSPYGEEPRFRAVPGYGVAYTTEQGQSSPDEFVSNADEETWCEWAYALTPDGVIVWEAEYDVETHKSRWVKRTDYALELTGEHRALIASTKALLG